jgi:putative transposase
MSYPYPPHHPGLPYTGQHYYFLTFRTDQSRETFARSEAVHVVLAQFLRAAHERRFEVTAYCLMPDHVHFLVHGLADESDCKGFIKAAKQYSGYYFKQKYGERLWQRYGFERVVRDAREIAFAIGYIVANPVRSGLVEHPSDYPHLGSQRYAVSELLQMCEYSSAWI